MHVLADIHAVEACAAEHQLDIRRRDEGADALPQQLDHRARAVLLLDAGAAELHDFTGRLAEFVDIIFRLGIEPADTGHMGAGENAVGADHARIANAVVVDDQQMVASIVELIEIAFLLLYGGVCRAAHFFAENAVAQALGGIHIRFRFGEAQRQITGFDRLKNWGVDH